MELSPNQLHRLLERFPSFELSYETLTHKKVPENYNICLGVPSGRKYFLWFTFYRDQDVCYLLELNKEKRITRATITHTEFSRECHIGTILYGSLVRDDTTNTPETAGRTMKPYFVIEDLYFYKGIPLKHICFAEKLPLLKRLFEYDRTAPFTGDNCPSTRHITPVYLPFIWKPTDSAPNFPYGIHHIQYRELYRICPYLNVIYGLCYPRGGDIRNRGIDGDGHGITTPERQNGTRESMIATEPILPKSNTSEIFISQYVPDFHKPQHKHPTIFRVIADVQYDIYHLYACGQSKPATTNGRQPQQHLNSRNPSREFVYYDIAYIPNYKTSVFMNGLFRNIRENRNLDYIEESDDEEDFENTREDKYVDTKKELFMECVFHTKFKRWVPTRVVDKRQKVIHIHKLAR